MALRDRITMLERRSAGEGMLVIIITGGLPDGEAPKTAEAGEHRWTQEPQERDNAFQARAIACAKSRGMQSISVGGLPRL